MFLSIYPFTYIYILNSSFLIGNSKGIFLFFSHLWRDNNRVTGNATMNCCVSDAFFRNRNDQWTTAMCPNKKPGKKPDDHYKRVLDNRAEVSDVSPLSFAGTTTKACVAHARQNRFSCQPDKSALVNLDLMT